jgi:acetylornithine deacetylase/succinyl-diaminopimelate desuccinylase-like protein
MTDVARTTAEVFRALAGQRETLRRQAELVLSTQVAVTQVPAPTGGEERRARWMADRLRLLGYAPRIDAAGNVVARLRGTDASPAVAVCAHLDTVVAPPADASVPIHREGSRVVGPGVCDNSRGLAALLAVASMLRHDPEPLRRSVDFVATTGEEGAGDLRGAKYYVAAERPGALIALDGAGDQRIVNGALGSRRFRVALSGPGGHSWSAFGVPNPVHVAGFVTAALARVRVGSDCAVTVARIGGGHSINAIPEDAWLEVDTRAMSPATLDRLERELHEIVRAAVRGEREDRRGRRAARTDPRGVEAVVTRIGERPAGTTPEAEPLVRAAMEATRLVGRDPDLGVASTDANAAIGAGIPAVAIGGGGRGGETHTSHEWYDDADGFIGVERALTLVAAAASL